MMMMKGRMEMGGRAEEVDENRQLLGQAAREVGSKRTDQARASGPSLT